MTESTNILNLLRRNFIDCGELHISRTSLGAKKSGERFLIYLPQNRRYLWRLLHGSKLRVRVFVELPEGLAETDTRSPTMTMKPSS
jgi:hypothetical protein